MKNLFYLLISFLFITQSFAQSSIAKGSKVTILEIAKGDTYYDERADFVGKSATTLGTLDKNDNGFYSGTLETESGRTCFFKNVKVEVTQTPRKLTFNSSDLFSGSISKGTKIKILEVSVDDSYYSDKSEIEGKTGKTDAELSDDEDGYYSGSVILDNGKSYYFYKVKLGKTGSSSSSTSSTTTSSIKFVTGTIKKGTELYLAEISSDDSYYSDRFDKIGKRGIVNKSDWTMKENGYYAGDFLYDDGSTAYFYKAKFSKEPVKKLVKTAEDTKTSTKNSDDDDAYLYDAMYGDNNSDEWTSAKNDKDIKEGDKVEITAVSPDDSYYSDKDDYIGKKGVAGDDLSYDASENGYGGTVKLDGGDSPYFFLVKLKKSGSKNTSSSTSKTNTTTTKNINYGESIAKGTKVKVVDVDADDSFYSNKSNYIGKSGKVAEGLTHQGNGLYSGKIIFTDKTDAYFFKVSLKKL